MNISPKLFMVLICSPLPAMLRTSQVIQMNYYCYCISAKLIRHIESPVRSYGWYRTTDETQLVTINVTE